MEHYVLLTMTALLPDDHEPHVGNSYNQQLSRGSIQQLLHAEAADLNLLCRHHVVFNKL